MKWILSVTSLELFNTVFTTKERTERFLSYTPGYWKSAEFFEKTKRIDKAKI